MKSCRCDSEDKDDTELGLSNLNICLCYSCIK